MLISPRALKFIRQSHLYVGIFIAPALLFFAFTGALQTLKLHEATPGGTYRPAAWILTLANIHKHQSLTGPPPKVVPGPKPDQAAPRLAKTSAAQPAPAPAAASPVPMQIFFLVVTVGLFASTLSGIVMSYKYNRNKPLVTGLLLAGIFIPLLLLRF